MKALFCHDHHYYRDRDNDEHILSKGQFHHSGWQRYLNIFDGLTVAGRDGGIISVQKGVNRADRDSVSFDLMPDMNSVSGILSHKKEIKKRIRKAVTGHDVVILRGISEIGNIAYAEAKRQGKTVALEMIGCPWDELWYHGSLIAKIYAPVRYIMARHIARQSDAVIYVSRHFLQTRYPSKAKIQAAASNVQISARDFGKATGVKNKAGMTRIGLIGTVTNKLKGVHVAIDACAILRKRGIEHFALHILGPGDPFSPPLKAAVYAVDKGVQDNIFFDGMRETGAPVYEWLGSMDIYIQPSFQEGVPRAMIEAMAQSKPAIGSHAGGIPELIDRQWIVPKGDAYALADKMEQMIVDAAIREAQGRKNYETAQAYKMELLKPVRADFWQKVYAMALQNRPKSRTDRSNPRS